MKLYDKAIKMLNSDSENDNETAGIMQTGETCHQYYQITPNGDNEEDIMWLHLVTEGQDEAFDFKEFKSAELTNNADTKADLITEEITEAQANDILSNF